jgi:hypothetical protein
MTQGLVKVQVALKGREIETYTFDQDAVTIGRCPDADIFLDNPGVSRNHLKLEATPEGLYAFEDLGSANGTYLNDQQIKRGILQNNDMLRVGKFSLRITYEDNLNGSPKNDSPLFPGTFEGTTVLSKEERERLFTYAKSGQSISSPVGGDDCDRLVGSGRWLDRLQDVCSLDDDAVETCIPISPLHTAHGHAAHACG